MISPVMLYELMVVGKATGEVDSVLAKIEKLVKGADVSNFGMEKLGRKMLAYPIAKQKEGEYLLFKFEAEPAAIGPITEGLRLERELILRYFLVKSAKAKLGRGQTIKKVKIEAKAPVVLVREEAKVSTTKTVGSSEKKPEAKVAKTTKIVKKTQAKASKKKVKVKTVSRKKKS